MKRSGNTILMTGGGSGIGEALAHRFHDLGNTVIVAGRRQDALDKAVAGRANMHAVVLDIDSKDGIARFAAELLARFPDLNILVNNAGIMRPDVLDSARDLSDMEAVVVTNLFGPIRLIDALIDHLKTRDDAAIVNVTSGLAFVPLVATATYSATKAALHSYTISLREALKGRVEVIELVPPAVQTELTPGQSNHPDYQPLEAFADEVIALFGQTPTPAEILVERVKPLRFVEVNEQLPEMLAMLNPPAGTAQH